MTVVDGYTKLLCDFIEASSIVNGEVTEVGDLLLTKDSGAQTNAGYVLGSDGPDGPPGDVTQQDLDDEIATVAYGSWANLPLATNWQAWGSPWAPPRYRYNDYRVELDGIVKYTGSNMTVGDSAALTTALPASCHPSYKQVIGAWAYQGVGGFPDTRIDLAGIITVYVFSGTITTNSWISLTGRSYPLA